MNSKNKNQNKNFKNQTNMLKKLTQLFAIVVLLSAIPKIASASHVSGGEVRYENVGVNQFKVTLVLYWDCASFDPGPTAQMGTTNNGGFTDLNFTVNLDTAFEVSQLCPSSMSSSTCNGGTIPGNKKNVYSAVVTLPGQCSNWTFFHTSCCRNISINAPNYDSFTFYATLNNLVAPTNNSPYFTSQPLPYLCVGQTVCYSPGVVETDGNSLSFAFVDAMSTDAITPITYAAGYTGAVPMPGITILPGNGLIQFSPTMIGNFVVVFQVTERDINGVVIGTVIRDIQMVVVNCTNQVVSCNSGAVTNLVGFGATILPPNGVQVCENVPFSFQFSFSDPDPADILAYTSNIQQVMPGAIITSTGTNPITISVSWNAPLGTANTFTTFAVTITDNACPVTGQQTVNYIMMILPATFAGSDHTICAGQPDTLWQAGGPGTQFNWTVLSGPPMILNGPMQNFSCDTCQNPVITPTATTTYILITNGSAGCVLTDTVTVFVVPDFTYTVTQSSGSTCLLDPVQLNVTNISSGNPASYTYLWSPATNLNNVNIANPTASFSSPGTYNYMVTVTSPSGCVHHSNISIIVAPAFAPDITVSNDTSFCSGNATLNVTFNGGGIPPVCGLSPTGGCNGNATVTILGNNNMSNTDTQYPAPFGNWYTSAVQQYLYTAAELNAAGVIGGIIDEIDWNVTGINPTAITTYPSFTIKMGGTNLTTFNSGAPVFQAGLFTVFTPQTVNATMGWNTFMLTNAFQWDGISNVIIEVCFTNGPPYSNYTYNLQSTQTATTYTSSQWWLSDTQDQCGGPTGFSNSANIHPDMRFHTCSIIPNPADFSYQWTAFPLNGTIANDTAQNTTASPTAITDYQVVVTSVNGGCTDIDTVHVDLISIATMHITPAGPYCTASTLDTLQVSVPIGTGVFSGPGIIDTNLGTFDPVTAGVGNHTIHYTVSSGLCGVGDTSIVIVVANTFDPTIAPIPPLCTSYNTITLSAATAGGSWSGYGITDTINGTFDPTLPGLAGNTNIVTYTIYFPCYSQDTAIVSVTQQVDATIDSVLLNPFCIDAAPYQLTSSIGPGGTWGGPGISGTGLFTPSLAGAGTHTLYHYLTGFCGDTAFTTVTVIALPVISISSDLPGGCEPTTIQFTGTTDQPGGTCFWNFGNGTTSTACNPSYTYTSYNGGNPYDVSFTYTNTNGCISSVTNTGMITIFSQPVASFNATPQPTDITNPEIHFHDHSTGVIDTWAWTFGNGVAGSSYQNPQYTYPDSGSYNVQLIVTNTLGPCADTINHIIVIDPIMTCWFPNSFTPDENGENDEWRMAGTNIQTDGFEMLIFNRWGERIFSSTDILKGWNGRRGNTGEPLELGTYVYKIHLVDWKGLSHEYVGHINLIR